MFAYQENSNSEDSSQEQFEDLTIEGSYNEEDPSLVQAKSSNSLPLNEVKRQLGSYADSIARNGDSRPDKLSNSTEAIVVPALKRCIFDAVTSYQSWYQAKKSGGIVHRHGAFGQERAIALYTAIEVCTELDAIQSELQKFFTHPNTRCNDHSFISFFLNELKQYPLVIDAINLAWFAGKYNSQIQFDEKSYGVIPRRAVISDVETLEYLALVWLADYTDPEQAETRKKALNSFQCMLQPVDELIILKLKSLVSKAFDRYNYFRNTRTTRNTTITSTVAAEATVVSWLFSPIAAPVIGVLGTASAFYAARNVGVLNPHGKSGNDKARIFEHKVAIAKSLDEIRLAFEEYFSNKYYVGNKTRCNAHSFSTALFQELSEHLDVTEYLNQEWFDYASDQTLGLGAVNFSSLNWYGTTINDEVPFFGSKFDSTALKYTFELFMGLRTLEVVEDDASRYDY